MVGPAGPTNYDKFGHRIKRLGYILAINIMDAIVYSKHCHAFQVHANSIHQSSEYIHTSNLLHPHPMDMVHTDIN